jgi:DNA repair exonuclease SbcCD ATPase subunit
LIDFTQQIESVPNVTTRSPAKSATESNLLQYITNQRSPAKISASKNTSVSTPTKPNNILNLLDFELPPAPTPRSVPTITVRELESLKSSYLSQISSLKATLSGREAEVDSLKKAVGDAERRVGEAQEALREEKCKREYAEQEIAGWKKRGQEFEVVLKSVKEEVLKTDADKEEMTRRLEDSEKRAEEAEGRAVKAEERFADALAARASNAEGGEVEEQVQRLVSAQIDAKIEAVSRELHSVYKEKHERKVATLKKSYEARNEKKTAELQTRVAELEKTNEELQMAKDATFSGPVSDSMLTNSDNVELKAQLEEQKAALARIESEMQASQTQQEQLMRELQQERIEKGDLVAAVDEMLALQAEAPPTPGGARAMSVVEDFRKSISRPPPASGLRAPGAGAGESKIGRSIPTPGLNRSGSGPAGKSRMLANIERMGRTGSNSGHGQGGVE